MKKILLMISMLMLISMSTVFAYSDESNADAQKVLDSIKDIRYNVEAGVNFTDYSSLVSKASIAFRKYEEKYPTTDKDPYLEEKFKVLLIDYDDTRTIWNDAIYENHKTLFNDDLEFLYQRHPSLKEKLPLPSIPHTYTYYEKALHALWSVAAEDEKSINNNQQK
ncbi:hypothetical protein Ga0466249_005024 [Sporomusaceae bacterium BoRhaA]|uniref:hypothetical protein n=1 Tax=Pelorhabdus rhamnosifermentans TaxID=2772457 RepID=UPI001C060E95|nr:hypothetical protein [Pelorhabdus rhamnosifermentans]MBU2703874.1 hypothetical protein [Pelorhabdus rhamnosifermentans]